MMTASFLPGTKNLAALLAVHCFAVAVSIIPVAASPADTKIAAQSTTAALSTTFFEPHPDDRQAGEVIKVVQSIADALSRRNYAAVASYMDDGCSTFDESKAQLVTGRDSVIADVKRKLGEQPALGTVAADPPNSVKFTINRPFAKVIGDTAVVNFVQIKEVGGSHPARFESHCTDIFVKRNGVWKELHYRGEDYKPVTEDR